MGFSYYQTAVNISDSANSIVNTVSISGGGFTETQSACPTQVNIGQTLTDTYGTTNNNYEYKTSINGKSMTLYEPYGVTEFLNESVTISNFPFQAFSHTSNFSATNTNLPTSSTSGQTIASGELYYAGTNGGAEYLYSTFTFTSTYENFNTSTSSAESTVAFGDQSETTTYSVLNKDGVLTNSSSGSFTSTRAYDFKIYTAPVNMSHSYNLMFFRDIQPNSLFRTHTPLLRLFTSSTASVLISNYNSLLNQTISASFSFSNFAEAVGSSINTRAKTTITLTTNSIATIPQTKTLTNYSTFGFYYGEKTFGFFNSTESYEYTYESFSETSSTIQYEISANWTTIDYGAGYATSAYSRSQAEAVLSTTTFLDISCNLGNQIVYTKIATFNTTTSVSIVENIYLRNNGTATDYAYNRFVRNGLATYVKRPFNFYSFSSQKAFFGNFVKNVSEETAYWGLNINTFAGIFDFSCFAKKVYQISSSESHIPKFFRFPNCFITSPIDPISQTISNVSISQSVSTGSYQTLISQSVYFGSTSSTRSFELSYLEPSGTVSWTQNYHDEFDSYLTSGAISPNVNNLSTVGLFPSPVIMISAQQILNTLGEMNSASYMADGAYYKKNSSEISFITKTEQAPLSVEGTFDDNSFSSFSIYTSIGGEPAILLEKQLQQFNLPIL